MSQIYSEMADSVMKLVNWERRQDKDGNAIFYNNHTKDLSSIPDPVFLLLEDKLKIVRKSMRRSEETDQRQECFTSEIKTLQLEKDFHMDQVKKFSDHIHEMEKNEIKTKEQHQEIIKIIEKIYNENLSLRKVKKENSMEIENSQEIKWKLQEIENSLIYFRNSSKKHVLDKEIIHKKNLELKKKLIENSKQNILKSDEKPRLLEAEIDINNKFAFKHDVLQNRIKFLENELLRNHNLIETQKASIEPLNKMSLNEFQKETSEIQKMKAIIEKSFFEVKELRARLAKYSKLNEKVKILELASASKKNPNEIILRLNNEIILLNKDLSQSQELNKNLTLSNKELTEEVSVLENRLKRRSEQMSEIEAELAKKLKLHLFFKAKLHESVVANKQLRLENQSKTDENNQLNEKLKEYFHLPNRVEFLEKSATKGKQKYRNLVLKLKQISREKWVLMENSKKFSKTLEKNRKIVKKIKSLEFENQQVSQHILDLSSEKEYYYNECKNMQETYANYYYNN